MTSPELTGGAGYTYEDTVPAYYLAAMICGTTAAALNSWIVQRVAQQQKDFGEPLDDVIIDAASSIDQTVMRLSLQVKREITISAAQTNNDFREAIQGCWETLQKPDFREKVDRVGLVTGSVAEGTSRAFETVCEWARASCSSETFMQRFAKGGNASKTHREVAEAVRQVAQTSSLPLSNDQLYRLFSHLVLIRFDFLHAGSTNEAEVIANLQRALSPDQVGRAGELWNRLRQFARDGSGRSADHSRASLLRELHGWRFAAAPAFAGDMLILRNRTRHWLDQQVDDIGGTHLSRQPLRNSLRTQMTTHRLTLIKGPPGVGKTVLLSSLLEELARDGTTLFLTANLLSGRSWQEYSRSIGLATTSIEPLLVEIAATGQTILFIDGLDRIAPEQRPILTDLLGQILKNPALAGWRVVATSRDAGIDPLRNWIPPSLLNEGVGYVDVENLTDDEASTLAGVLPALRALLNNSNERVRTVARRPFFAAVLARGFSREAFSTGFEPQSELDLVEIWWQRGGYDTHESHVLAAQRALIELAERSALDLGRNLRIRDLSATTLEILPTLEENGLVQQVRRGHSAQFKHDIFFEWSFLHLLLDQGDNWIASLIRVGEPPALARVVELLSQMTYPLPDQWHRELQALEMAPLRPQWLRAWLVAPVFSPRFAEYIETFTASLIADDYRLLGKFLVWMQAEKTRPNPLVLSGAIGGGELDAATRVAYADSTSWPSDFSAWRRTLTWVLEQIESIPDTLLHDIVTLFNTWQIALESAYPNPVSQRIVTQCVTWLHAIEDKRARRRLNWFDYDDELSTRAPMELEAELRGLVLRSAQTYPDIVAAYLTKVEATERIDDRTFREIINVSPLLAKNHSSLLSQIVHRCLIRELPDETSARLKREEKEWWSRREEAERIPPNQRSRSDELFLSSPPALPHSFLHQNWDSLSINDSLEDFFPAKPLREPFHSLLEHDPARAISLIRDLLNHATKAWRQLHRYLPSDGTPLPIVLEFPWGHQEFWGADRHYMWFRGHGGSHTVECALMALEMWAIDQQNAERPLDDLLQHLLEGHTSIGVLGIAVHLALRSRSVSPAILPLVSSQRLWRLDVQRQFHEHQLQQDEQIEVKNQADAASHQLVANRNLTESRHRSLPELVLRFLFCDNATLRDACSLAVQNFPNQLEFAYQEEALDPEHTAELRQMAVLWAEKGKIENYTTAPVPNQGNLIEISMHNPQLEAPEEMALQERHAQRMREIQLWVWVEKSFKSQNWAPGYTVDEVVKLGKKLIEEANAGREWLTQSDTGLTEGVIAGTAAAIICFTAASEHLAWANATIDSFCKAQDEIKDVVSAESVIPWHPKLFVGHALAARIKSNCEHPTDRIELYRLITHPLDIVSISAVADVAGCWERDRRFAWCGLNLGLQLAQLIGTSHLHLLDNKTRLQMDLARRATALSMALDEYNAQGPLPSWVRPLPSWVREAPDAEDPTLGTDVDEGWQSTDVWWDGRYAAKVLQRTPVAAVMASEGRKELTDAVEAYLGWTLDTINPSWRTRRHGDLKQGQGNLYEWMHQLGELMAKSAPHLTAEEILQRLLQPIFAQPDDIAMQLLAPFTSSLICREVFDAPLVRDDTIIVLQAVVERVLTDRVLRRSPNNDRRVGGSDLADLVKSLLFVGVEQALGATRFANGCWDDLSKVMPVVDRLVCSAGWHPYVASQFVVLCKHAGASYPASTFADQVLAQIVDGNLPASWKNTTIPSEIAALVQAHADRLHPLPVALARKLLQTLDALVDLGDRRSSALQQSESFRGVRLETNS